MKGYIYKFSFPNGKVYIGQTIHPRSRLTQHLCESTGSRNIAFWRAYEKYDTVEYRVIQIIERDSREELCNALNELEQKYIAEYKSDDRRFGYNLTSGGKVFVVNEEGRRHMSEARSDKLPILQYDLDGHFITEYESTTEAAKALNTHPGSIWNCCLGVASGKRVKKAQIVKGYTFRFKHDYPDVPHKIDLTITSKKRPVLQFALDGSFLNEWGSILEASLGVGGQESGIRATCYGKYRQSNGYMWRFKDEFETIPCSIPPVRPKKTHSFPILTLEQIEKGKRICRERNARPVLQFTFEGLFVAEFPSLDDAAKPFSGLGSTICNACKVKSSKSAYGYQWRYKEDVPNPALGIAPYQKSMGRTTPIIQITANGQVVKEWPSVKEAAHQLNVGQTLLYLALSGRKEHAHGFKWIYKDNETE